MAHLRNIYANLLTLVWLNLFGKIETQICSFYHLPILWRADAWTGITFSYLYATQFSYGEAKDKNTSIIKYSLTTLCKLRYDIANPHWLYTNDVDFYTPTWTLLRIILLAALALRRMDGFIKPITNGNSKNNRGQQYTLHIKYHISACILVCVSLFLAMNKLS